MSTSTSGEDTRDLRRGRDLAKPRNSQLLIRIACFTFILCDSGETCFASAGHDKTGVDIVRKALSWPTRQIALNAGDGSIVVGRILDKVQYNFGYGAQSGEYGKLVTKIVPSLPIASCSAGGLRCHPD
jgi:hypothetical protein